MGPELVLEGFRGGADDGAVAGAQDRYEVGEGLAGARVGFDDATAALIHDTIDELGHLDLAGAGLVAGEMLSERAARAEERPQVGRRVGRRWGAGGYGRSRRVGRAPRRGSEAEGLGKRNAGLQATIGRDGFGGFAEFHGVGVAQGGGQRGVGIQGVVLGFECVGDVDEVGGGEAGGPGAFVGEESGGLGQGIALAKHVAARPPFRRRRGQDPRRRWRRGYCRRGAGASRRSGLRARRISTSFTRGDGIGLDGEVGVVHPQQVHAEALGGGFGLGAAAGGQFAGWHVVQGGVAVGDGDDGDVVAALAMARQGAADGELGVAGSG